MVDLKLRVPATDKVGVDAETLAAIDRGIKDADEGRTVPIDEVRANSWDLSISRYIARPNAAEINIEAALARYRAAESALTLAQEQLAARLGAAGYE